MEIIDAQIHLWNGPDAPPHHWRAPFTIERAVAKMDEAGVDRSVNCPAIWDDAANDYAIEAVRRHPDRFATMGWFPLTGGPEPDKVTEWMEKPGMLGLRFMLYAPEAGPLLSSDALDWLWQAADEQELPVALMVMPEHLPLIDPVAARHPGMRLLLDHLAVNPFVEVPEAVAHLDQLLALAENPNVAVKATGIPSMAADGYPFESTHDALHQTFDVFGPQRFFWGSDISRLHCTWAECITTFTEHLPWLAGDELELVMGRGLARWIGWQDSPAEPENGISR
ncbi:MAG: amidohydrolase family protein [Nocardioides sp.]